MLQFSRAGNCLTVLFKENELFLSMQSLNFSILKLSLGTYEISESKKIYSSKLLNVLSG